MNVCKTLRHVAGIAVVGAAGLALPGVATATEGYCIAPAPLSTDPIALTDVTFTIGSTDYSPVDCYGITDTGASNIADALPFVNALRWEDFVDGVKDDVGGGSNSVTVDGIQYTLTTGTTSGSGLNQIQSWTLAWSDTNGVTEPNLPVLVNFVLDWKGGNNDVLYLFQDVLLPLSPTSGSGTIEVKVTNRPGTSDIGTSHLDLFFSDTRSPPEDPPPDTNVPEPASIALVAAGLLALAARRRKRSR